MASYSISGNQYFSSVQTTPETSNQFSAATVSASNVDIQGQTQTAKLVTVTGYAPSSFSTLAGDGAGVFLNKSPNKPAITANTTDKSELLIIPASIIVEAYASDNGTAITPASNTFDVVLQNDVTLPSTLTLANVEPASRDIFDEITGTIAVAGSRATVALSGTATIGAPGGTAVTAGNDIGSTGVSVAAGVGAVGLINRTAGTPNTAGDFALTIKYLLI